MNKVIGIFSSQDNKISTVKRLILAFQHLIAMFGATVLVPILTGMDTSVAIFSAGVGTLIFHFCTKFKVPVFLGSSFAFIPVIITVKDMFGGDLTYAQGGIIISGLLYVIMSVVVKKVGIEKLKVLFPPVVVGPMVMVIGMNLIPTAINMATAGTYNLNTQSFAAIITLGVALGVNFLAKGFIKQLSIVLGVVSGYTYSLLINLVDLSIIQNANWLVVPNFTFPKFDFGAIMIIAPVIIAVFMEHIGDITTNGAVVGKNFMVDPGLNRTLLGDGLATVFAGFVGAPANTTYGENTGVLAITKNYDPSIIRITALIAICVGFIGKVGGVLNSIPVQVMGGISIMLFSMISIVGVKTLINNKIRFDAKNIIVIAVVLIIGLGAHFGINISIPITSEVSFSGLSLAAIVGIFLNRLFDLL